MPHFILLTGAGFSKNWGGWLADEAFEYLLGHPRIDDGLRKLLWKHKDGGFEAAVEEQRIETARSTESYRAERDAAVRSSMMGVTSNIPMLDHSQRLDDAIRGMFTDMNKAFGAIPLEFSNQTQYLIRNFLVRFDAIFTLNQDLLLEQHYLDDITSAYSIRQWNGGHMPGMRRWPGQGNQMPIDTKWSPAKQSEFVIEKRLQPFFKLHGSSNWFADVNGEPMLIIGGNKASAIDRFEILRWNLEQFGEHLSKRDTRLMVIGYSFGDEHINEAISDAADGDLRLFIIDPLGVDVLNRNPLTTLFPDSPLARMQSRLRGASRRTLSQIFGGDLVEHGKVMRFFTSA